MTRSLFDLSEGECRNSHTRAGRLAGWKVRLFLLVAVVLALMATPVLVNATASATVEAAVSRHGPSSPCVAYQVTDVLGRESGLLALLGVGGQIAPVASLVKNDDSMSNDHRERLAPPRP